jgi:ABC-type lipoprotein export system ATPase subunit
VAAAITVRDLHHTYRGGGRAVTVLEGVNLDIEDGSYVALTGPSGAGKTTLLSVLGGLERPQSGSVLVAGADLARLSGDQLALYRQSTVGFVFQHFGLLDTLTAEENVALALMLAGVASGARRARADALLDAVGLAGRERHRPVELSGGERQRVAIARALANRPRLVLADEPTGNLDEDSATLVVGLLETLPAAHGCTVIMVTHNRALAARAGRCLALSHGRIREDGAAVPV